MRFIDFLVETEHRARASDVASFIKDQVLPQFSVTPSKSRLQPNPQNREQYILSIDADTRNLHNEDKEKMDALLKDMGARVKKLVVRSRRQRLVFVIDPEQAEDLGRDQHYDDMEQELDQEQNPDAHMDDLPDEAFDDRVVDVGDDDDFEDYAADDQWEQKTWREMNDEDDLPVVRRGR